MADSPRLEELRRRVQADPASIAFAALAEEYRRAGKFREAVEASRAGLRYHPTYVSARVTLGRSLVELQEVEQAERELAFVLKSAPDNLAARRALGELCWQQLRFSDALVHFRTAHTLAPADTELPTILQSLERELAADRNGANGKAEEPAAAAAPPAVVEKPVVEEKKAAEEDTLIFERPPQLAATPQVEAAPVVVEAAPQVEAAAVVEAAPVVEAVPQVETAFVEEAIADAAPLAAAPASAVEAEFVDSGGHLDHFEHVDRFQQVDQFQHGDHFQSVDRLDHIEQVEHVEEHIAEFEPIDAVAFVDDHAPVVVADATPVVIEELPGIVEVVDEPAPQPIAAVAVVTPMNGHAPKPAPNPALQRLERFHRAILAARKRSQQQQLHS